MNCAVPGSLHCSGVGERITLDGWCEIGMEKKKRESLTVTKFTCTERESCCLGNEMLGTVIFGVA